MKRTAPPILPRSTPSTTSRVGYALFVCIHAALDQKCRERFLSGSGSAPSTIHESQMVLFVLSGEQWLPVRDSAQMDDA
jgi:hypothetical protein